MSAVPALRVGFGLARLHHLFSAAGRERIVLSALDAGCAHFDAAPLYGEGMAEAELGRSLRGRRKQVTLATKFGIPCGDIGARMPMAFYVGRALVKGLGSASVAAFRDFSPVSMRRSLDASLRRLRTDWVDYLFVHEPLSADEPGRSESLIQALDDEKRAGRIRRYGIAGPTALLAGMQARAALFGDALQFGLSTASSELLKTIGPRPGLFAYGLYGHRRAAHGDGRLDIGGELRWFREAFPGVVPILSTNREDEVQRIARAIAGSA